MKITPLNIEGAFEIQLNPLGDERGYFMRSYDHVLFAEHGLQTQWVQDNQSHSTHKGTLRGLHFQLAPAQETKLVRAVAGAVFDVCVDVRKNSATYGQWVGRELTADNQTCLYIPKGCAHGFCTLVDDSIITYKVDAPYTPDKERSLHYADSDIGIDWPLQPTIISDKDKAGQSFKALESEL